MCCVSHQGSYGILQPTLLSATSHLERQPPTSSCPCLSWTLVPGGTCPPAQSASWNHGTPSWEEELAENILNLLLYLKYDIHLLLGVICQMAGLNLSIEILSSLLLLYVDKAYPWGPCLTKSRSILHFLPPGLLPSILPSITISGDCHVWGCVITIISYFCLSCQLYLLIHLLFFLLLQWALFPANKNSKYIHRRRMCNIWQKQFKLVPKSWNIKEPLLHSTEKEELL